MEAAHPFHLASLFITAKALILRFSSSGPIVLLEHAKFQDYYGDSYGMSIWEGYNKMLSLMIQG